MKILMVLSKEFIVDPRVYREATSLVKAGHQVTVVMWDRHALYEPESTVNGIRVVRLHNTGCMQRLPHDVIRNPLWWWHAYQKGVQLYNNGFDFDVVHCHDLDTLLSGVLLKNKLKCTLVYDAHEIFGYMIENDVPRIVTAFAFRMEKILIRHVDHLITVNDALHDYFKTIYKKPITIVMNCKELPFQQYSPPKNKVFTVSFIGNLTPDRLFPQIINALGEIPGIRFVVAGKKENMKQFEEIKTTASKYKNVEFLGQIPIEEVLQRTCEANVVITPVDPSTTAAKIGTPNKLFEAMACGRPSILTKGAYAAKIAEDLHIGIAVDYTIDAVKEIVAKLRDNPQLCETLGRNAFEAAKNTYNWGIMEKRLLNIYKTMT
ncbi:MAG: glycosyltransferase family 4 protein [Euryarchaeota archaeon]|nr:glycosyltransferase family 4 protein [Euryarchaeota archaeon]